MIIFVLHILFKNKGIGLYLLLFLSFNQLAAQSVDRERDKAKAQEYASQHEQYKKTQLLRVLDSAVLLMDQGRYEVADQKFKYVLANLKSVPSDLTFHFGKNSFHLNLYQQSIDWLNKYIQLKGTNGQFSQEAIELKQKAETEYLKVKAKQTDQVQQVLTESYEIDCGPSGKVTCPACKGDHVVVKKGPFGYEYQTCKYCNEHGILTCEEYNQLIRGELKPKL